MTQHSSRRSFLRSAALACVASSLPMKPALATMAPTTMVAEQVKGLTVLFQGDSITDGKWGRNGDLNHIMGHGYAFSIASRWGADFPSPDLRFYNRGISGNRVSQLQDRWQTDCLDLRPNVLSILVGINDAAMLMEKSSVSREDFQAFEDSYRDLLTQVRKQDPKTLIVLCLPFLASVGKVKDKWERYQSTVNSLALSVRKLAIEFDAVLVDFQMVFQKAAKRAPDSYWIWDGIHPTVPGHELMAREWLKQVSARLKFLKKYA
ncbi:GDSL-type esterase/lipase family protein [Pedobacter sp. MC2016-14]|uniref:SGNH/GDSL hydrolase family protein n=1 Tax=Pedobacter sp. MC2016-14 TaxID=2897327 RepID=UPI001E38F36B|nr:SGNH/GDSL hydrolase family protein [Pedobacter sp. MC2016-14]MCD0488078.1 GDSL-type esterase/lipase family protein [Pedobacter sp. MC2016-14]